MDGLRIGTPKKVQGGRRPSEGMDEEQVYLHKKGTEDVINTEKW